MVVHPKRFLKLRVDDVLVRVNVKKIVDDLEKGYEYDLEGHENTEGGEKGDKRDPVIVKKARNERLKMQRRIETAMRP